MEKSYQMKNTNKDLLTMSWWIKMEQQLAKCVEKYSEEDPVRQKQMLNFMLKLTLRDSAIPATNVKKLSGLKLLYQVIGIRFVALSHTDTETRKILFHNRTINKK